MKHPIIIYASLMLLLLSCKSQKDVSHTINSATRDESLVVIVDTTQTHLETSHNVDGTQQEDRVEYSKTTNYGSDNNVSSITERYIYLVSKLDFKSQWDTIKREDFRYTATVATSDTTSTVIDHQLIERSDGRLVQGWEWLYVIIGIAIVLVIVVILLKRRII